MSARPCVHCGVTVTSGALCRDGLTHLVALLRSVPDHVEALTDSLARQVRFVTNNGSSSTVKPLPVNLAAGDVLRALQKVLTRYARLTRQRLHQAALVDTVPPYAVPAVPRPHEGTPSALARYLIDHAAPTGSLYDELSNVLHDSVMIIDCPPERVYLGPCRPTGDEPCQAILWADSADVEVECRRCGSVWSVDYRRGLLSDRVSGELDDRIMTATDAAEALIAIGVVSGDVSRVADRIRKLASHRPAIFAGGVPREPLLKPRLTIQVPGQRRRPGYRVGDIKHLLTKGTKS